MLLRLVNEAFRIRDVLNVLDPTSRDVKLSKYVTAICQSSVQRRLENAKLYLSNCRLVQNASLIKSLFVSFTLFNRGLLVNH